MTSEVTIYHIPADEIKVKLCEQGVGKTCVNIIDTPGFGDTRGPKWDEKIFEMLSQLLHELESLDYFMIVVKSTDNRLGESMKFVYNQIQGLYATDISERVLGMFTFSDGNDPHALEGIKAAGININDHYFKFNNGSMWANPKKVDNTRMFFNLGLENYGNFAKYMIDKN